MPLAKFIPSFFAFILTLAVPLDAMQLREAKESHKLTVAHAVNEVAKGMASQVQIALKKKDFAAAEAINDSLSDFLSSDDKPASLINVPEIANRYATKRKESAQVVFQRYRDELSSNRLASDPLHEELDEFIKKETHAQLLGKSGDKDAKMAPASATGIAQSSPESLPRKAPKKPTGSSISTTRKPSTKPIGSRSDQDDPSILTPELIQQMDDRIMGIQEEYISKFDGATTDIQRQKVASAHRDAAIEECFGAATSMHIEIDCELINSRATSEGYTITYRVLRRSLPSHPGFTEMTVSKSYKKLAEASAGTKFRIHVPVAVLDGSNPDPILQLLENRFRFSQEIGFEKSTLLIGDLPDKASSNKKTKAGSGRHPLMNLSVSLYAVWLLASIESDEIPDLPEFKPPEIPELGGSKRR
jgi:hypothetical protein